MLNVEFTNKSKLDIGQILAKSRYEYGEDGKARYEMLISHGVDTIATDPDTFGVNEIAGYKSYHLKLSKKKVAYKKVRVKNPPHMIIFKVEGDTLYVLRVLHDVMKISDHL